MHSKVYLFDIDGVLTNPETKKVENPAMFYELVKRIEQGNIIGMVTGRSVFFITEKILKPLESRIKNKQQLQNILVAAEYGGVLITHNENNTRVLTVQKNTLIPLDTQQEIKQLISQDPYAGTMFYDETKRTMATVEMLPAQKGSKKTLKAFKKGQGQLAGTLTGILNRHGLQGQFKIDQTRIATDIESVNVGKAFATRKIVELLAKRGISPEEYLVFGDGALDYDMYKELRQLEKSARFIFVGEPKLLVGKDQERIIFTNKLLDEGTLEFLQKER